MLFSIAALDRRVGSPLARLVTRLDRYLLGSIEVHPVGLFRAEEDEWLLMTSCCCQLLALLFPSIDVFESLIFFDETLPAPEQAALFCLPVGLQMVAPAPI